MAFTNFFANLSVEGSSELVVGELVTDNYFSVLGVRPALGRDFTEEEFSAPSAFPVAVLSYPFWQGRFAGDPDILGRTFRMNGTTYTVIGVAPRGFGGMFPALTAQMWIPTAMVEDVEPLGYQGMRGGGPAPTRLEQRGRYCLWAKGRLNPGVTVERRASEWPGWLWCTSNGGRQGWAPESWMSIDPDDTSATMHRDYVARELTAAVDDAVEVLERESGWAWAMGPSGEVGWVPLGCLEEPL